MRKSKSQLLTCFILVAAPFLVYMTLIARHEERLHPGQISANKAPSAPVASSLFQSAPPTNVYGFQVKDIDGNTKSMSDFAKKVLLIVNVASL
mmetsp:Transcript_7196/g.16423  ORF Transcript_7196/g.16423 Transcript_7196/m.16423 type:complete len:93 (+) Transcript_7196:63-341(+)